MKALILLFALIGGSLVLSQLLFQRAVKEMESAAMIQNLAKTQISEKLALELSPLQTAWLWQVKVRQLKVKWLEGSGIELLQLRQASFALEAWPSLRQRALGFKMAARLGKENEPCTAEGQLPWQALSGEGSLQTIKLRCDGIEVGPLLRASAGLLPQQDLASAIRGLKLGLDAQLLTLGSQGGVDFQLLIKLSAFRWQQEPWPEFRYPAQEVKVLGKGTAWRLVAPLQWRDSEGQTLWTLAKPDETAKPELSLVVSSEAAFALGRELRCSRLRWQWENGAWVCRG